MARWAALALSLAMPLRPRSARADDWAGLGLTPSRSRVSAETSGNLFNADRWSYALPPLQDGVYRALIASPAVADGYVIIGGSDRFVRALRERDGKPLWTFSLGGGAHASPTIENGVVFAASLDRQLYALRLDSGALLWKRDLGGLAYSSPVVADGNLFIAAGSPSPRVFRLNADTGGIVWVAGEGVLQQAVHASVASAAGHVLVGEMDGNLHSFAATTGAHEWTYRAGGTLNLSSPLVVDDRVYLLPGGDSQRLFAIDLATGASVPGWPIDVDLPDDGLAGQRISQARVVSSPAGGTGAPAGARIVFEVRLDEEIDTDLDGAGDTWVLRELTVGVDPAAARIAWIHPNGRRVTPDANQIPIYGLCPTPALYGARPAGARVVTASTLDPRVRVLDLASGTERWSAALSGPTRGSPVMANGRLFVGTDAGILHALLSATNHPPEPPTRGFFPAAGQAVDPWSLRLRWAPAFDAEAGALTYQVRWDDDGEILRTFAGQLTTAADETAARVGAALAVDQTYTYAIRSRDRRGAWSAWSEPQHFRTVTSPPVSMAGRSFASLTAALEAARPGDTIRLGTGTYHPSSSIALPGGVSLAGSAPHLTIIDAGGLEVGISVDQASASKTQLLALTVDHAAIGIGVRDAHDVELRNVILRDNREAGLEIGASGSAQLVNATVVGNGIGVRAYGTLEVRNTLVTRNGVGMVASEPSVVASRYNDIFANRDAEVENVAAGIGDLHAMVRFVGIETVTIGRGAMPDLRVEADQPSTDRGDPADGFELEPMPNGGRINLGAFGNTPFAETSARLPTPTVVLHGAIGRIPVPPAPVAPTVSPPQGAPVGAWANPSGPSNGSACSLNPTPASRGSGARALVLLGVLASLALSRRRSRTARGPARSTRYEKR